MNNSQNGNIRGQAYDTNPPRSQNSDFPESLSVNPVSDIHYKQQSVQIKKTTTVSSEKRHKTTQFIPSQTYTEEESSLYDDERVIPQMDENEIKEYGLLGLLERCPFFFIICCFVISGVCVFLILYNDLLKYTPAHERDYLLQTHDNTKKYDAVTLAEKAIQDNTTEDENKEVAVRTQMEKRWTTHLIFLSKVRGGLVNRRNIRRIRQVADNLRTIPRMEDFCMSNETTGECDERNFMRGAVFHFGEDLEEHKLVQTMKQMSMDIKMQEFFSKALTLSNPQSNITRVIYRFGTPLEIDGKRYKNREDESDLQEEEFEEMSKEMEDFIEDLLDPDMEILVYSDVLYDVKYLNEIADDAEYISGSIIFFFVWMVLHTRSIFLSVFSMVSVAISFPISYLLYRSLLGIQYVGVFHMLTIFLIFGIATDNMFIFLDAYRHSKCHSKAKFKVSARIKYCFYRAVKPIAIASGITMIAFGTMYFSYIVPVMAFGVAMGILIFVNFLLLLVNFIPAVVLNTKYISKMCDCIACLKKVVTPIQTLAEEQREKKEDQRFQKIQSQKVPTKKQLKELEEEDGEDEDEEEERETTAKKKRKKQKRKQTLYGRENEEVEVEDPYYGCVEKAFGGYINKMIFNVRPIIPVALIIWMCFNIYFATEIKGIKGPEEFLPERFQVRKAREMVREEFRHGDG